MQKTEKRHGRLRPALLAGLIAALLAALLAALPGLAAEGDGKVTFTDESGVEMTLSMTEGGWAIWNATVPEGVTEWTFPAEYEGTPIVEIRLMYITGPSLTQLTFPEGEINTSLEVETSTYYCPFLETINIPESNPYLQVVDGVVYSKDGKELICYPSGRTAESYTIPDGISEIDLSNKYLKVLTLSADVRRCYFSFPALEEYRVDAENSYYRAEDGILFSKLNETAAAEEDAMGYDPIWSPMSEQFRHITLMDYPAAKAGAEYTVPEGVERIGWGAFGGNTVLRKLALPESLLEIGMDACSGCTGLEELTIRGLETTYGAFWRCSALRKVTLPGTLSEETIAEIARDIYPCEALEEIVLSSPSDDYFVEDGVLFGGDGSRILCFPLGKTGHYTVPDTVTSVYHVFGICRVTGVPIWRKFFSAARREISHL